MHFAADSFSFAENAEDITAQNLADIVGAVTAIEEGLRDFWQVGGGVDAFGGRAAYAVKIRAQPDVIDAGDLGDMVDVVDQRAQRRPRNSGGPLALDSVGIEVGDGFPGGLEFVGVGLDGGVAVFGLRFRGLAVVLVDEGVVKIYLDYATVLGHGAKHVVGHVAGVIG